MEIEFIALKKNYYQIKQDLDQEKLKNENVAVELINLVNENKALQRDIQTDQKISGEVTQSRHYLEVKNERIEQELQESREALLNAQSEANSLKAEMQSLRLMNDKGNIDVGNRKMELERQFLEMNNQRSLELNDLRGADDNASKRFQMERDLWDGEKTDLLRKMKELNRKIEEYQDDVRLIEDQNQGLKSERSKLKQEIEEVRKAYRDNLSTQAGGQNAQDQASMKYRAREEHTRSFQEKEAQLNQSIKEKDQKIDELFRSLRALKRYARQLKYLAEDLHPIGQPLPEILTQQPPVSLEDDDEDINLKRQQGEINRLRQRNQQLEENFRELADKSYTNEEVPVQTSLENPIAQSQDAPMRATGKLSQHTSTSRRDERAQLNQAQQQLREEKEAAQQIQNQLLQEIENLKGNQQQILSRPGTASQEVAQLREERDRLLAEARNNKQQIQDLNA